MDTTTAAPAAPADLEALLLELASPEAQAAVAAEVAARPLGLHGPEEFDDLASSRRWAAREARRPRTGAAFSWGR